MGINGIATDYYPTGYTNNKTFKTGDEVQFSKNVMACVAGGGKKVMLCSDAVMSYASPQTGESVNIYRANHYSKENPIYIIKGIDANGNAYEQEIDAGKIDPNHCSYNEMMVLNVETGHTSPSDYLHSVAMRDKSGTGSYFESTDYIAHAKKVMSDMKTLGSWDRYLSYDRWINDIVNYCKNKGYMPF